MTPACRACGPIRLYVQSCEGNRSLVQPLAQGC